MQQSRIDVFSAMLISTEIVDVRRFSTPWKLVSCPGLAPRTRIVRKNKNRWNNKTRLIMVKMRDTCSMCTLRSKIRCSFENIL